MIQSFATKETEALFRRFPVRKLPVGIQQVALRKLWMIDAAFDLSDLRVPPANHLEKLRGNREGQYSIRVNNQWRICFRFEQGNAYSVEIVDYHS